MPNPKTRPLAGAALALTAGALTATAALAQTATAQAGETARREALEDTAATARAERTERSERAERREVRVYRQDDGDGPRRGRDAYLTDMLQLRPDQAPALKAFLEATRRDSDHENRLVRFDRDSDRTTLERLDEMQARLAAQQAETSRRIAAIRTFYGQLDPAQKKAFDTLPMLMFSGASFGPALIAAGHPMPPRPPEPPEPPRL